MLAEALPANIFAFLVVFARMGGAFMFVPGFGEAYVPARVRLVIALLTSLLVLPVVSGLLPAQPPSPLALLMIIAGEATIGLMMGLALRLTLTALHVGGTLIAYQSSLASAQFFDPAQQQQGAIIGSFLTLIGITLIFVSNLHHVFIEGAFASYDLFPPAALPQVGDLADIVADIVAGAFLLGTQIAAPFLVYGLTFYIGIGLINRLMPQVQAFLVMMPLQIALSFLFLAITIGAISMWFLESYEATLMRFFGAG